MTSQEFFDIGNAMKTIEQQQAEIDALRLQREALLRACKAFDLWFSGWCPISCSCCASTGLPVHNMVRDVIDAVESEE